MLRYAALLGLLAATVAPAAAQLAAPVAPVAPNEPLRGIERGIEQANSSAQVGSMLITPGNGNNPTIVIDVKGAAGKPEIVTINRGFGCADDVGQQVAVLGTLSPGGRLHATSPLPFDHLMSGNYNIIVHNSHAMSQSNACGHLYLH